MSERKDILVLKHDECASRNGDDDFRAVYSKQQQQQQQNYKSAATRTQQDGHT